MPSVSKKQQKFMGIVRSIQKGEQPASKFSKKAQDVAKNMKRKDVKKYASTKHKNLESILSENPIVAATVMQMTKMQMKNPKTGKSVKASTPLRDKSHPLHKKSKSLFQRIKDKLSRKKDKPKKQSKADVDFYKKQYTGESVNEAGMELKKLEDAIKMFQKKIKKQGRVTNARDEDHLENLIKIYKQMGGKKIKEAVKLKGKSGMGTISHVGMPPASKGVEKLFKIADGGFGKVGGQTVDSMSANLFKQIYDKASDDIKLKLNKKNEKQLVMIISKMWDKFGKNVSIGSSI